MIEVRVRLYSILREKLPAEARGRATMRLADRATLADLLRELDIGRRVVISVNGKHEPDSGRVLRDGDEVRVFSSVGGGACVVGMQVSLANGLVNDRPIGRLMPWRVTNAIWI